MENVATEINGEALKGKIKKHKKKLTKGEIFVKIMAGLLAGLMVLSVGYTLIVCLMSM